MEKVCLIYWGMLGSALFWGPKASRLRGSVSVKGEQTENQCPENIPERLREETVL